MGYEKIVVRPIAGALGAEVSSVDLTDLGNQAFSEIHRALLDHQVLYFDDQPLDDDQLEALTRRFGPFGVTPFIEGMPGHPEIIEVRKDADEVGGLNFGGRWHERRPARNVVPPTPSGRRPAVSARLRDGPAGTLPGV